MSKIILRLLSSKKGRRWGPMKFHEKMINDKFSAEGVEGYMFLWTMCNEYSS
jgi:hypothetical protein